MKNCICLSEDEEQEKLFDWAKLYECRYPELRALFHIPNGGLRDVRVAKKLKRQGVKPGVSDLFLSAPKGQYHGLYIEMKIKGNHATDKQIEWLRLVKDYGYATAICYGYQEARNTILKYLSLNDKKE